MDGDPITLAGGDITPSAYHPGRMVGKRMTTLAEMAKIVTLLDEVIATPADKVIATPAVMLVKGLGIVPMPVVQTTSATSLKVIIKEALQDCWDTPMSSTT